MRTFIGHGAGNAPEAVQQATSGLSEPKLILFVADFNILGEVQKLLAQNYSKSYVMGFGGTNVANGKTYSQGLSVLAFFDDAKIACGIIEDLSTCPVMYMGEFEKSLLSVQASREDSVCIDFCTNNGERVVTTLNSVLEEKQIPLIGGTIFGTPQNKPTIVAFNGKTYTDATVYAIIKNMTGRVHVYKENIYVMRDNAPVHFATKVDVKNNAIFELDGKSACEVYTQELGVPREKIIKNTFASPLGRIIGKNVFIASLKELDGAGGVKCYNRINSIELLYFLKLGDYKQIEADTREQIKKESGKISLVLSIDCAFRYLLYTNEKYFDRYVQDMAGLGPHFGYIGGGEQFCNQHINQTMVCVVFE